MAIESTKRKKYSRFLVLTLGLTLSSAPARAEGPAGFFGTAANNNLPAIVSNALPTLLPKDHLNSLVSGVSSFEEKTAENGLIVHQDQESAIINWETFNIGEQAWVHFDQQGNTNWRALNRIYDRNPSQIYGQLTADGQVYLINQNGILFGAGSYVNTHSLIASSLDISNEAFTALTADSTITLQVNNYQGRENWTPEDGFVVNQGEISVELTREEDGEVKFIGDGSVFLVAPHVENSGTIVAPFGQAGLAAGEEVSLAPEKSNEYLNEKFVRVTKNPGDVVNHAGGNIVADNGRAGMYGKVVNQDGLIRTITSVRRRGRIELMASEHISTGAASQTIAPVVAVDEKTGPDFVYRPGEIELAGLYNAQNIVTAAQTVEHLGHIQADSGKVTIYGADGVVFGSTSVIDVSGAWSNGSPDDIWRTVELNTAQLKDDHLQKDGVLYRSEVTVNEIFGSTIGDLGDTLTNTEQTSLQKAAEGGTILVEAIHGDIVVSEGAVLDISGGGIKHAQSTGTGTKLLHGNTIYDIGKAPEYLRYNGFADFYEKEHARFGITEEYQGLYYGGAIPLYDVIDSHIQGFDAGTLTLTSRNLFFEGTLLAGVTVGPYQIYDPDLFTDGIYETAGKQYNERQRRPRGGKLQIGGTSEIADDKDTIGLVAGAFTLTRRTAELFNDSGLQTLDIQSNDKITTSEDAALKLPVGSFVNLTARSIEHKGTIDIPSGSVLMTVKHALPRSLPTGGLNPLYDQSLVQQLTIAENSRINVGGERIDNTAALDSGDRPAVYLQTDGGSIVLLETTTLDLNSENRNIGQGQGVVIAADAELDVRGGYEVTESGELQPGDAGELTISGSNIIMDGNIKGHSLPDASGGTLSLYANQIHIGKDSPARSAGEYIIPTGQLEKGYTFGEDRFASTGFGTIALNSVYGITIAENVTLSPSSTKELYRAAAPDGNKTVFAEVPEYQGGKTGFSLKTGQSLNSTTFDFEEYKGDKDIAAIHLPSTSALEVLPGGSAEISGPQVTIDGKMIARAGKIKAASTGGDLIVGSTAVLDASGYIRPSVLSKVRGLPVVSEVMDAGSISLANTSPGFSGSLIVQEGSLLDVDGTPGVVTGHIRDGAEILPVTGAGRAGDIILSYAGDLQLHGTMEARSTFPGQVNGNLTIDRNNPYASLTVNDNLLAYFRENNFYGWTISSNRALRIENDLNLRHSGTLTLDAPLFESKNDADVFVEAAWLRLGNSFYHKMKESQNSQDILPLANFMTSGSGSFTFQGRHIDITGAVGISGAATTQLAADQDIRLSDQLYNSQSLSSLNADEYYAGWFGSTGDIELQAARIYPGVYSDFTVEAADTLRILPGTGNTDGFIYSAAGNLILKANRIDHQGYLAAPLGSISFSGTGDNSRIMLSPDSVTSTRGEAGMVAFGELNDTGEFWTYTPRKVYKESQSGNIVEILEVPYQAATQIAFAAPAEESENTVEINGVTYLKYKDSTNQERLTRPVTSKNVTVEGDEVIVREGARIDIGGGGALFDYQFLPGLEGTVNPLLSKGQYVVVPGLELPGKSIQISGGGLPVGNYTILPLDPANADNARYAFLPGAYILKDLGSASISRPSATVEGYPTAIGYLGMNGGNFDTSQPRKFTVRPVEEVLQEGKFAVQGFESGDGGSFDLVGRETMVSSILEGAINGLALPGYEGGTFRVAAQGIEIGPGTSGLDADFEIGDELPAHLKGKLTIKDSTFSGNGFKDLKIGVSDYTRSILLKENSRVAGENISLHAGSGLDQDNLLVGGRIRMEKNALIEALQPETVGSGYSEVAFATKTSNGHPQGSVTLEEGSLVHAADHISFDTDNVALNGNNLQVDNSSLSLKNEKIVFSDGAKGDSGLYLTSEQWASFANIEEIYLDSKTDILFSGDFTLDGLEHITFDAQRIGGYEPGDRSEVSITAPRLTLANSKVKTTDGEWLTGLSSLDDTGTITFNGANGLVLGSGDVSLDGFSSVILNTDGDLVLTGQALDIKDERGNDKYTPSALTVPGDMEISAARITLAPFIDYDASTYKAADYKLTAGDMLHIKPSTGSQAGSTPYQGGQLTMDADAIVHEGIIHTVAASITMNGDSVKIGYGTGVDETNRPVESEGTIRAVGSATAPAGKITINAVNEFQFSDNGVLDVSAGSQGDAGTIRISAPQATSFSMAGTLLAAAQGGKKGSFSLDAGNLGDFSTLISRLYNGGFTNEVLLRSRTGNLSILETDAVYADHFKLVADTGVIDIKGTIDASNETGGGAVEILAGSDLTLHGTADIKAKGTGAGSKGGNVTLASTAGTIKTAAGSSSPVVDVSGGDDGSGGSVYFRALRNGAGVKMELNRPLTVKGAERIEVEAVKTYNAAQIAGDLSSQSYAATSIHTDTKAYMESADAVGTFDSLLAKFGQDGWTTDSFHFRPGVEIQSSGNLSFSGDWKLFEQEFIEDWSTWPPEIIPGDIVGRYGAHPEPLALTFRAAGNLNMNGNISDMPTPAEEMLFGFLPIGNYRDEVNKPSASYTFIAGADISSADIFAVKTGQGMTPANLTIANGKKIYTETGDIHFASSGNTVIGTQPTANAGSDPAPWYEASLSSNLATYRGDIKGYVGNDLTVKGVIQTATGDIGLQVEGNVSLRDGGLPDTPPTGAMRTTGIPTDTTPDVDGYNVVLVDEGWAGADPLETDMLRFYDYAGGGDITLEVGGDLTGGTTRVSSTSMEAWSYLWIDPTRTYQLEWSAAYGYNVSGTQSTLGIATMSGGNVMVSAAGDISTQIGTFGRGDLTVQSGSDINGRFLVADGQESSIYAQGSFGNSIWDNQQLELLDSNLTLTAEGNITLGTVLDPSFVLSTEEQPLAPLMGYSENASVELNALNGDVLIEGSGNGFSYYEIKDSDGVKSALSTIPSSFTARAGRDILFDLGGSTLEMAPGPYGGLELIAGRDITGTGTGRVIQEIKMTQADPDLYYGLESSRDKAPVQPLHRQDNMPVIISAGRDVQNMRFNVVKKARISAGRDILDLELAGQNINGDDITSVHAGRDIVLQTYAHKDVTKSGILLAGPGALIVQADNIDLGSTGGIRTVANGAEAGTPWSENIHPGLSFEGADIYVASGISSDISPAEVQDFFDTLRASGKEFSELMAEEKSSEARAVEDKAREEAILPLFGATDPSAIDGTGNIRMTQSRIATLFGGDVNILSAGAFDVGGSSFAQRNENSGVKTEFGGNINIYSVGDLNVNESRAMTWMGGDITVWGDGDINAGRGSKTAVNASGEGLSRRNENGVPELFKKPSVGGSGIRGLTYDPDGPGGQREMPEVGDIYLFAPNGIIDAGEAGIVGGTIYLAATKVLNANNISFSQSGVGVPAQTGAAVSIGSISGAGAIAAATSEASNAASGLDQAQDNALDSMANMAETLVPKVLKVEVIDLVEE